MVANYLTVSIMPDRTEFKPYSTAMLQELLDLVGLFLMNAGTLAQRGLVFVILGVKICG